MKNKYISFVALAAAALATSCASDDLAEQKQEQSGTRTVTLTASVNEGQTRVGMTKGDNNTASFYWHKNDKILVQTVKDGSAYSGAEFSTETATGKASASFTGEIGTDYEVGTYAVYPYDSENQKHSFTGEKAMTYNLPAKYENYTPESKIFGTTDDYRSNPTNMPMLGTISGNSIKFKCLGGLAVIRIDKMPAESGTLTVTADQQLSGDFTVSDLSTDGAQIATTTASGDNGKVTFTFNGASTENAGVFYLPLATGNYTNLTIQIIHGGTTQTVSYSSLSVARKSVTAIPLYNNSGTIEKYFKDEDGKYIINGHRFIDLGLSVLWAETNIGAETETAFGSYYAWGETQPKTSYVLNNYTFYDSSLTYQYSKYYTDGKTVLEPSDDAATVNWHSPCRMPTEEESQELCNSENCTWTNEENGVRVTSKIEGYTSQSIFLPLAGVYAGTTFHGNAGYYWLSSTGEYDGYLAGHDLQITDAGNVQSASSYPGCYGFSVRPVVAK